MLSTVSACFLPCCTGEAIRYAQTKISLIWGRDLGRSEGRILIIIASRPPIPVRYVVELLFMCGKMEWLRVAPAPAVHIFIEAKEAYSVLYR